VEDMVVLLLLAVLIFVVFYQTIDLIDLLTNEHRK